MELGTAYVELKASMRQFETSMKTAQGITEKSVGRIQKRFDSINFRRMGLAIAAVGVAITGFMGKAIKESAGFETALVDMGKVTSESLESIRKKIMGLPPELGGATQLVKGYYQVISAGVKDPVKAVETLTVSAQAAKAAHIEQSEVIKGLTKMMAGYEGEIKNVSEAADLLFTIEKEGQTTVAELIPVIGGLAKMSHDLGISQNEMGAAMATVTKTAGDTSEAATQYRGVLLALTKPSKEMKEALASMGYESAQAAIETLGLAGTLQGLKKWAGGSQEKMGALFGRVRGLIGASALAAENFATLTNTIKEMEKKTGAADRAFEDWKKTMAALWDTFKATLGKLMIEIGDILAPIVKDLMEKVAGVLEKVRDWMKAHEKLTPIIFKTVAAVGALMIPLGSLLMVLPGLVTAFGALKVAILATNVALLATPVGWLLIGLSAIALAAYKIMGTWERVGLVIKVMIGDMLSWVLDKLARFVELLSRIPGIGEKAFGGMAEALENAKNKMDDLAISSEKAIADTYRGVELVKNSVRGLATEVENTGEKIKNTAQDTTDEIKELSDAEFEYLFHIGEKTLQDRIERNKKRLEDEKLTAEEIFSIKAQIFDDEKALLEASGEEYKEHYDELIGYTKDWGEKTKSIASETFEKVGNWAEEPLEKVITFKAEYPAGKVQYRKWGIPVSPWEFWAGFKKGGIIPGHLKPIVSAQMGGIFRKPTLATIAEGGPEAAIPLKGGKIPVELTGATGINIGGITIQFPNVTSFQDWYNANPDLIKDLTERKIVAAMKALVREGKIKEGVF